MANLVTSFFIAFNNKSKKKKGSISMIGLLALKLFSSVPGFDSEKLEKLSCKR